MIRFRVYKLGDARLRGLTESRESAEELAALFAANEGGTFYVTDQRAS